MNKILSFLSVVLLLITLPIGGVSVCAQDSAATYSLAELKGKIKTQGRVYQTADKLYLDWSASGVEFTANCSGEVYVTFDVETVNSNYQNGGVFFTIVVDGKTKKRDFCRFLAVGVHKFKIASNLSAGEHYFEIYRQNQIGEGVAAITAISLDGTVNAAPKESDIFIEFIGDSITVADGVLATADMTPYLSVPLYVDATQGYAYLTAHEHLKVDFSTIAINGIGASVGWTANTMQEVYPKLRFPRDKNTDYTFVRKPTLIVLALGTNDITRYQSAGLTMADVKKGFVDMLKLVRQKNQGVPVLWIHGMMVNEASSLIEEVVKEAGGAKAGVYELRLPKSNSGGNGHPNVDEHAQFAEILSEYIKDLLNIKTETPTQTITKTKTSTTLDKVTNTTVVTTSSSEETTTTVAVGTDVESDFSWVPFVLGGAAVLIAAMVIVIICLLKK